MIALGCDHGGYRLMKEVIKYLEKMKALSIKISALFPEESCDYLFMQSLRQML